MPTLPTRSSYGYWPGSAACGAARSDPSNTPTNTDVDGVAVAIANVVTGICLRILITWSDEDIDEGIQASLIQTNAVLLSTLASIDRNQLSIFDAQFALLLSSSPLTVYLVIVIYCWLFGMKTGLDNHISPRPLIVLLGAWTPFLWLVLSMLLRLSSQAFIDSHLCVGSTFGFWLHDIANSLLVAIQIGSYFYFFVPFFSICLTLIMWRRWSQVTSGVRPPGNLELRGWFRMPWRFVKHIWEIIDRHHKWYIHLIFVYLDVSWAIHVISGAVKSASHTKYILSFGQILSVSATIPPLVSTVQFTYARRLNLLHFTRHLPSLASAEVKYLVLGRKPDTYVQEDHLPAARPNPPLPVLQEPPHELRPEEFLQPANYSVSSPENLTTVLERMRDTTATEHGPSTARVAGGISTEIAFATVRHLRRSRSCPSLKTGVNTVEEEHCV